MLGKFVIANSSRRGMQDTVYSEWFLYSIGARCVAASTRDG
jgi:hypothetical protein